MASAAIPEGGSDRLSPVTSPTSLHQALILRGLVNRCLVAFFLGYVLGVNGIDLFTLL